MREMEKSNEEIQNLMFNNDLDRICRATSNNLAEIVSPNLETAISSPQKTVQKSQ